jgi:hypothetical protein
MSYAYRAPSHPGMRYSCFVDPEPPDRFDAPAADAAARHRPNPLPRVDEELVRPETREELVRGRLVMAPPAKEPHADCQADVVSLARRGAAPGYVAATELLTCTGPMSDFATDACIRREGIDPTTGARYLEELAFEVVAEQTLREITERAEDLSTRGVRRIFAVFVKTKQVREWSPERNDWILLDPASTIEDRTLAAPIPVRALLDAAEADHAVVQALYAKKVPAILAIENEGRREGIIQGIEAVCQVLGISFDAERRTAIGGLDVAGLRAVLHTLGTERRWP